MTNRLLEIIKNIIEDSGCQAPNNFEDMFNFLYANDQVIIYIDDDECVTGFVCFMKYGRRSFKFIKNKELDPTRLTKGSHCYIPFAASRFDRQDNFNNRIFNSIKNLGFDEVTFHNGQDFIICDLKKEDCND